MIKTSKSTTSRVREDIVKNTCIHIIKDIMTSDFRVCVIKYIQQSIETIYSLYTKGTLFAYNIKDNKRTDDSHQSLLQMPHHTFLEKNFPRYIACVSWIITPYM